MKHIVGHFHSKLFVRRFGKPHLRKSGAWSPGGCRDRLRDGGWFLFRCCEGCNHQQRHQCQQRQFPVDSCPFQGVLLNVRGESPTSHLLIPSCPILQGGCKSLILPGPCKPSQKKRRGTPNLSTTNQSGDWNSWELKSKEAVRSEEEKVRSCKRQRRAEKLAFHPLPARRWRVEMQNRVLTLPNGSAFQLQSNSPRSKSRQDNQRAGFDTSGNRRVPKHRFREGGTCPQIPDCPGWGWK